MTSPQITEAHPEPFDSNACLKTLLENLQPILESLRHDFNARNQRYIFFQEVLYIVATITAFLIAYLFYLIYMVTIDMHKLTDYMEKVSTHFVVMSDNINEMQVEIRTINQTSMQIAQVMTTMNTSMVEIQQNMGAMQTTMQVMSTNINNIDQNINSNLNSMRTDLHDINKNMAILTTSTGQIRLEMQEIRNHTNMISYNFQNVARDMSTLTNNLTPLLQRFNNLPWLMMPNMPMLPF